MQVGKFKTTPPGYFAHKIKLPGTDATFSAWYDGEGKLTSCEKTWGGPIGPKQKEGLAKLFPIIKAGADRG